MDPTPHLLVPQGGVSTLWLGGGSGQEWQALLHQVRTCCFQNSPGSLSWSERRIKELIGDMPYKRIVFLFVWFFLHVQERILLKGALEANLSLRYNYGY